MMKETRRSGPYVVDLYNNSIKSFVLLQINYEDEIVFCTKELANMIYLLNYYDI